MGITRSAPTMRMVHNLKIMIVDDDKPNMEITKALLRQQGFQSLDCYENLQFANQRIWFEKRMEAFPDVILLNYSIQDPWISTTDFCRDVCRLDPSLPVIGMTGKKDIDFLMSLNETGISNVVFKPLIHPENASYLIDILTANARLASIAGRKMMRMQNLLINQQNYCMV